MTAAGAVVCAISIEITFCVRRFCESAVMENAPTRTIVATANTGTRMWDMGNTSKHRLCDEDRILQASLSPSQRSFTASTEATRTIGANQAIHRKGLGFSAFIQVEF